MVDKNTILKKIKTISILGSTGSIGQTTLDIIRSNPESFKVKALTAGTDVEKLYNQAIEFKPEIIAIADQNKYLWLKDKLNGSGIAIESGPQGLIAVSNLSVDFVMASIVGAAGLMPTMNALKNCNTLALANKECLVCAGELFMNSVRNQKINLLPVDSEHNAIFQLLERKNIETISRLILTASGGPFRLRAIEEMSKVTPNEALVHPNWKMGPKISIDSATMMNKGFELIEAYHIFDFNEDKIDIVIHPESIVHSLVEFIDGSTLAQLGTPDMKTPIAYSLAWPKRMFLKNNNMDFNASISLNFEPPDHQRFPALKIARDALKTAGNAPTILNAANEVAVDRFLKKDIKFLDIVKIIEYCLNSIPFTVLNDIEHVLSMDAETRKIAKTWSC